MFKTMSLTLLPAAVFGIFSAVHDFQKDLPNPVQIKEDYAKTASRLALKELGAPKERLEKLTNSVYAASIATKVDPVLIASIIRPESEFKINAKSPVGYKGLMQTPKAIMEWSKAEVDVMYGTLILKEKIDVARGNVDKAMVYYKGHGGEESQRIAAKQMQLYRMVKEKVTKKMKEMESA